MLKSRFKDDSLIEIGIDEAGRGCLWGPLMAGAVVWPLESNWNDTIRNISMKIKDSKKISATKREKLADEIKRYALYSGTGFVSASEVDSLGATKGNQLAFRRALDSIQFSESDKEIHKRICIDGILPMTRYSENEIGETIIDGDEKYISIAAASILAKVTHDKWVKDWCESNSELGTRYDFLSCKGYGTAKHRKAILEFGPVAEHRKLYLRKLIPNITVSRYEFI
jgi:ribonuclease HII